MSILLWRFYAQVLLFGRQSPRNSSLPPFGGNLISLADRQDLTRAVNEDFTYPFKAQQLYKFSIIDTIPTKYAKKI
jgi:hypothetical protein